MPDDRRCPNCGEAFPADAPAGLCVKCLLGLAVSGEPDQIAQTAIGTEQLGDRIGRYKLLQKVGEGGCGIVYMAEQEEPVRRKVALKVIKLGMDTKSVIARFEAERQALALMDHQNIAKVLDAGATDAGRPYFVMELVRGIRITEYCDQHNLPTRERLNLFTQICHAIQHAHQKGIIHRDIKPSNILVTLHDGVPVPKVIDFGIAKATSDQRLTDKTLFTAFEQFIGTPAYMSPEQAEMSGLDIDTRSDIYALGVLLYELLTGRPPFDPKRLLKAGLDEIRRIIREEEPPRPSTRLSTLTQADLTALAKHRQSEPAKLAGIVSGDLDWIVMKCLEKDRIRRYETANGLAMDIHRHLINEPVVARPPSSLYRFQKLVRRNKVVFGAAGAVAAAFVIGLGISVWQSFEKTRAYRRAVAAEKDQASQRQVAESLRRRAEEDRAHVEQVVTQLEIERAESLLRSDSTSTALAYLARLLRQQPTNRVAAERLLAALGRRSFCVPVAPLAHDGPIARPEPLAEESVPNLMQFLLDGWVTAGGFSPDGRFVATAGKDGVVRVWDAVTGQAVTEPLHHDAEIVAVQFSADGRRLVTASCDRTAKVWAVAQSRAVAPPLRHPRGVWDAAFLPDGTAVVTACADGKIRLWNPNSGVMERELITTPGPAFSAEPSADGRMVLVASLGDYMVRLVELASGRVLGKATHFAREKSSVPYPALSPDGNAVLSLDGNGATLWQMVPERTRLAAPRHQAHATCARISPDGKFLATASVDTVARLWHANGQTNGGPLKHEHAVSSVAFSADSSRLVTASRDRSVRLWDVATATPLAEPLRLEGWVWHAQISPYGERLVTFDEGHQAWLWEVRVAQPLAHRFQHGDDVRMARFSPDGERVVTASWDGTARVWDANTGRPVTDPVRPAGARQLYNACFTPNGQFFITCAGNTRVDLWPLDTSTGQGHRLNGRAATHLILAPDGATAVLGAGSSRVTVESLTTSEITFSVDQEVPFTAVDISSDGRRIVTAGIDGSARVWNLNAPSEPPLLLSHKAAVHWVEFSADGRRVVTASKDKTARVWDAVTGTSITPPLTHADELYDQYSTHFSPNGQRVATAAGNMAQIWDSSTGEPVTRPLKHEGRVNSVRFSPDGRRLVTACYDGTVHIWDAVTGHALSEPLRHAARVYYAEFSSNGQRVLTSSTDKTARVWDVPSPPVPVPDWLPELAEALAGQRIVSRDLAESVPVVALYGLRRRLEASPENDFYARWGRWFFGHQSGRPMSPTATISSAAHVQNLIEADSVESLREARCLAPTNALALIRLARRLTLGAGLTNSALLAEADILNQRAVEMAPDAPEVWLVRGEIRFGQNDRDGAMEALRMVERLRTANPVDAAFCLELGRLQKELEQIDDAESSYSKAIALLQGRSDSTSRQLLRTALGERSDIFKRQGRHVEAGRDVAQSRNIPDRDLKAATSLIDLSLHYNATLDETFEDGTKNSTKYDLSSLPIGVQRLDGIAFDVRGLVLLSSSVSEEFSKRHPVAVTNISIRQSARRLHFLHAAGWSAGQGNTIGSYRVNYVDGSTDEIPLVYGGNIRNCVLETPPRPMPTNAVVAWTGTNSCGTTLQLFHSVWTNAHPGIRIESIDFRSTVTRSVPVLVAISAEP